jgi:acyl-homoserine lactone acylase PvdQ
VPVDAAPLDWRTAAKVVILGDQESSGGGAVRRIVGVLTTSLLVAALAGSPAMTVEGRTADPPEVPDHLRAFSVIPPGQSGEPAGAHALDQLGMYAALIDDDDVTDEELNLYFHSFQFGPGALIESTVTPRSDVTIYRDTFGIPHIYGTSDAAAAFGAGYATAQDRMWHADILRRSATGRLSEFLGPDLLTFDREIRRDGYSSRELRTMHAGLSDGSATDQTLHEMLKSYSDGINQRIQEIKSGAAPLPAEYLVQQLPLEPWRPIDTIALIVFQLRQFGESAGNELRNAALFQELRRKLGPKLGTAVFRDFTDPNDPAAYSTIPESEGTFDSQSLGPVNPESVAIPDRARRVWQKFAGGAAAVRSIEDLVEVESPTSNFLAVGPSESATGGSLQFGAPQVGYSVPQFFMELDVHSPGLDFRGPALPGAALLVPLGRGIDYAWSLTTAVADAVDTRVELLCGRNPTKSSNRYMFEGTCRRMTGRTETIQIGSGDDARSTEYRIFRTVHGPVVARATVDGNPVAIVRERTGWKKEIDTVRALHTMASNQTDTLEEVMGAAAQFTAGFNFLYVDAANLAYVHAGAYPMRSRGVDPMLPVWGTGRWEWKGRLPFEQQPQMVNPEQGWAANWNNKPAVGWDNGDSTRWGVTHRVRLLSDAMEELFAGGKTATLSDVVDVARQAATRDAQAVYLWESLSAFVSGSTGTAADARAAVADWVGGGAHRRDRDRNGVQDFGPAVAVWDTWYDELVHRVFDDELGGLYELLNVPISDGAPNSNGSAYSGDLSMYLWHLFNGGDLARDYCDDIGTGAPETCAEIAAEAFDAAVEELSAEQGSTVATWTWPADYIEFDAVGAVVAPPIPWQNRGTYNHAVEVTGAR